MPRERFIGKLKVACSREDICERSGGDTASYFEHYAKVAGYQRYWDMMIIKLEGKEAMVRNEAHRTWKRRGLRK